MRYKLIIEYDGTSFCGWQRQREHLSVQQVLEDALAVCLREKVIVFGSGRTDAGVHAMAQVAHFDCQQKQDCGRLRESINALVRPYPISVREVEIVDDSFHARFSAKQRTYFYKIINTQFPPALDLNRAWWVRYSLDEKKMHKAAQLLIGKHDFSTFRASECQAKSPVKTVDEIRIWRENDYVLMQIKARSFLHHQVRNIIGTLMLVGCGKWTIDDFKTAFEACNRRAGGQTAPATGLYFMSVLYD